MKTYDLKSFVQENISIFTDKDKYYEHITQNMTKKELKKYNLDCKKFADSNYYESIGEWSNIQNFSEKRGFDLLEPIFSDFIERFDNLFKEHVYVMNDADNYAECNDFTFFKILRIKRIEGEPIPELYIKNGNSWLRIMSPNSDQWILNPLIQSNDFFNRNTLLDSSIQQIALVVIVAEMFNVPELIKTRRIQSYKEHINYKNTDNLPLFEEFHKVIYLFDSIISYKFYRITSGCKSGKPINQNPYFKKPFTFSHNLKKVRCAIYKLLDKKMCQYLLIKDNQFTLSSYFKFIATYGAYKQQLLFWEQESHLKLIFILKSTEAKNLEIINNKSLFSYERLVSNQTQLKLGFLDKKSLQKTLNSNRTIVKSLFDTKTISDLSLPNSFRFWAYWLGHTRHTKLNTYVFLAVKSRFPFYSFDYQKPEHQARLKQTVYAIDLFYDYLLIEWAKCKKMGAFLSNLPHDRNLAEYLDYLFARDGEGADHKNYIFPNLLATTTKATIKSLQNKSNEWHRLQQHKKMGDLRSYDHLKSTTITIEDVIFELITNNHALADEAIEMHHCVASFDDYIYSGEYLVFRVISKTERATLGLFIDDKQQKFSLNQCYGYSNSKISEQLKIKVSELIKLLNTNSALVINKKEEPKKSLVTM